MMFDNILNEMFKRIDDKLQKSLDIIKTPEGLKDELYWTGKKYAKNPEKRLATYLTKKAFREKEDIKAELEAIEKAPDFSGEFIITVEWKKSYTWGSNPKAYTNEGFESRSIGGCGYDKLSTATAYALNSNKSILKELCRIRNTDVSKSNHEVMGYGSGYGLLPHFEGGVGTSRHQMILEKIGLEMQTITSTKNVDVFLIKKKGST